MSTTSDGQNQDKSSWRLYLWRFLRKFKNPRSLSITAALLLLLPFQNCQQFEPVQQTGLGSATSTSTANGSGNSDSTNSTPNSIDTANPSSSNNTNVNGSESGSSQAALQQKLTECASLVGKPVITATSLSEVTVLSGLGNNAGDAKSANISVTAEKTITNAAKAAELGCPISFNLVVEQLNGSSTYPHNMINAIDLAGNQKVPSDPTLYKQQLNMLVSNSIEVNSKTTLFDASSKNIFFRTMRTGDKTLRCSQGVAWFRLRVVSEVVNSGTPASYSDEKQVKVNIANNCWTESRLKPANHTLPQLIQYGYRAAITGDLAAVISPKEHADTGVLEVGTVYVFERINGVWNSTARFQVQDAFAYDGLSSIAIANGRIIAASKRRDNSNGVTFVYTKSGTSWQLAQKILPQTTQAKQQFGQALAVSGNYLFIGAPNLNSSGAVYVYEYVNGNYAWKQTLSDKNGVLYKGLGMALSVDGTNLLVGAPQDLLHEADGTGEAQLFNLVNGNWTYTKTFTPSNPVNGMRFGSAVATKAGHYLVGASGFMNDANDSNRGAAFYYANKDAAANILKGRATGNWFGDAVAVTGVGILIGAPYFDNRTGRVYSFSFADISKDLATRLHYAQNASVQSDFGSSIVVSGTDVLIGARNKNDPNTSSGAAYIYVMK